jgi:tellurite methyltransferase
MAEKSTGDGEWPAYYAATRGRPPRATLLRAMRAAESRDAPPGRRAIDLGCGAGRDTLPLLAAGWHVLAIDAEPAALDALDAATPAAFRPRLVTRRGRVERTTLPRADLVNASFCLFFADRPAALAGLFARIAASLVPGGRFAGHLLGCRDSWVRSGRALGVDRATLDVLLGGLRLEHLGEEETDSVTPRGEAKHWHVWHINAARPEPGRITASWWRS